MMARSIRTALIQMNVGPHRLQNIENAAKHVKTAKENGAQLIALPENFSSLAVPLFRKQAEAIHEGPVTEMLSKTAKENSVYLVGGAFPEIDSGKYYNSCTVWNPEGDLISKYRKLHMFDVDITGKLTLSESQIYSSGNDPVIFDMDGVKVGLGICYDLRFEELAKLYRLKGCHMLMYTAAFSSLTGPLHFELLQRARAVDNQVFVCAVSPARTHTGFKVHGFSQITNPWGKIVAQAKENEEIIYADINLAEIDEMRQQIPIFSQRRTDIYTVEHKK